VFSSDGPALQELGSKWFDDSDSVLPCLHVQELLRQKEEQQEGALGDDGALFAAAGGAGTAEAAEAAAAAAAAEFVPLTPEQQKVRPPEFSRRRCNSTLSAQATAVPATAVQHGHVGLFQIAAAIRTCCFAACRPPLLTVLMHAVVLCMTGGRSAIVMFCVPLLVLLMMRRSTCAVYPVVRCVTGGRSASVILPGAPGRAEQPQAGGVAPLQAAECTCGAHSSCNGHGRAAGQPGHRCRQHHHRTGRLLC
jgi:hypothetical protein